MIIECPYCESKVDGEVKGEQESYDPQEDPFPFKAVLLKCPICHNALLGGSDYVQTGPTTSGWSSLTRLWPQQESHIAWEIPVIARNSLVEARNCFKARAYSACVVMSGKTLEGVCLHHSTKSKNFDQWIKGVKGQRYN